MARKPRLFVLDTPQHIYLKGMDSLLLFRDDADYEEFLSILKDLLSHKSVALHSYLLMPNYFELLLTPKEPKSLAKFIQNLSKNYVTYYNKKYKHSGTIWDGRYKASLVEASTYLLEVMKFIEKKSPSNHIYSSLEKNLYAKEDTLVQVHKLFSSTQNYQEMFEHTKHEEEMFHFIENALLSDSITASKSYIEELEKETGRSLLRKKRGRPTKKEQQQRKKMYKNLVILDKQKHSTLKVNPLDNLLFAKDVAYLPISLKELFTMSQLFPIVFSANETPSLVAVVSVGGENLAVTLDGKWIDSYIPTHIAKYPFALATTESNSEQKIVMIDESASVFSKSKGKQLFKKNGENSEVLEKAIKILVKHEENMNETKKLTKEIAESGILEKGEISATIDGEQQVLLSGFQAVSKEKLEKIPAQLKSDWEKRGVFELINTHLASLKNIELLFKLAQQRQN